MVDIDLKLQCKEAPGLTTYGSLWEEPVTSNSKPVIDLVVVQSGRRTKLTKKLKVYSDYKYRFVFGQFAGASKFKLTAHIRSQRVPLPPGASEHATAHKNINVFTFTVV